ncbi:MAG: pilus assembly protein PilZ [Hyphomicrobiales bacterium]|nr:pilus assembly protein PilZ [Hyphomicrobiales bacterium]
MTPGLNLRLGASEGRRIEERERRHARVSISLKGRGLLADGTEFDVHTVDVSAGGMCLRADVRPKFGEKIVVYLEVIGGLEGEVARLTPDGFSMSFRATLRKREQIADQLTWLINRDYLGEDGQRRAERIRPRRIDYTVCGDEGDVCIKLLDISRSGVAVLSATRLAIGAWVTIGRTRARVVRHIPGGFAAEFARAIPMEMFDADIVL